MGVKVSVWMYVNTMLVQYNIIYSETSLIRHSMGPENNVGLGGCWIIKCLLTYIYMVAVPHIMVGLERMLDYRGVGLARFHCNNSFTFILMFKNWTGLRISTVEPD